MLLLVLPPRKRRGRTQVIQVQVELRVRVCSRNFVHLLSDKRLPSEKSSSEHKIEIPWKTLGEDSGIFSATRYTSQQRRLFQIYSI